MPKLIRAMRWRRLQVVAGALLLGLMALAQQTGPVIPISPIPPLIYNDRQARLPQWMLDRMMRERAKINQAKIRQETTGLVKLSQQLQHLLSDAPPNLPPALAIEKAKQIEKLAHKIRNRLRSGGE